VTAGLLGAVALVGLSVTETSASPTSPPSENAIPQVEAQPIKPDIKESAAAVNALSMRTRALCLPKTSSVLVRSCTR
jgi:hypothetical protein